VGSRRWRGRYFVVWDQRQQWAASSATVGCAVWCRQGWVNWVFLAGCALVDVLRGGAKPGQVQMVAAAVRIERGTPQYDEGEGWKLAKFSSPPTSSRGATMREVEWEYLLLLELETYIGAPRSLSTAVSNNCVPRCGISLNPVSEVVVGTFCPARVLSTNKACPDRQVARSGSGRPVCSHLVGSSFHDAASSWEVVSRRARHRMRCVAVENRSTKVPAYRHWHHV
jgi:hypothetical protein